MSNKTKEDINVIAKELARNYRGYEDFDERHCYKLPNLKAVLDTMKDIRRLMFPGFFGPENPKFNSLDNFAGSILARIYEDMVNQVQIALNYETENCPKLQEKSHGIVMDFIAKMPEIQTKLMKDVQAMMDGDPAADSHEGIIFSYPGLYAIFVYRIAHELYKAKVPFIPRMMSEEAHSRTGIDINPGATIGEYFMIDHGTGIVIGETAHIGNHVKIYQGVTVGALSTAKGQGLKGVKRHPTIEDHVVLYANTTVLGGETVIGHNSVIGGNSFITNSIPPYTQVLISLPEHKYRKLKK